MPGRCLIYGATGYTGALVARRAARAGLDPVLAGRDPRRTAALAAPLGCEWRAGALGDAPALARALEGVAVVLNAAGPFARTARPLVDACLRAGVHYLDVTGELPVLEAVARRHAEAERAGVMLMPAAGFMVVPSDCLLAHLAARLPRARRLWLGVSRSTLVSRGSARTLAAMAAGGVRLRRAGTLREVRPGSRERAFDFGGGYRHCTAVSWADLCTAWHGAGIPDIETYLEISVPERAAFAWGRRFGSLLASAPWQAALQAQAACLPSGPSDAARARDRRVLVADLADEAGRRACARLTTPDAYGFTAAAAVTVLQQVLAGRWRAGYRTPAGVYGAGLLDLIGGTRLEDLC